jgi:PAS domain S-box-containing protein
VLNLHQIQQSNQLLYEAFIEQEWAVAITNADRILVYVNDAFLKMVGYRLNEVIGRKPAFLQGPLTTIESKTYVQNKLQQKVSFEADLINYRKNGEAYICHIQIRPIFNKGELTHFVAYEEDIETLTAALPKDFQYGYYKDIKNYFLNEEVYCNPLLQVADISTALNIPERCIGLTIRAFENITLSEFINKYRITLVLSKLPSIVEQNFTLESLYKQCGFNSRSVFIKAFKAHAGVTPKEYLKELEMESN